MHIYGRLYHDLHHALCQLCIIKRRKTQIAHAAVDEIYDQLHAVGHGSLVKDGLHLGLHKADSILKGEEIVAVSYKAVS